jgi:hypothetical protein
MFQMVACNFAVLAIAMIYYAWRDARAAENRRRAQLNERVACMLWAAAQRAA